MRFSPIIALAAGLAVACLPLTAAEAQNSRAFGHGAPFTIDDLPPGLLQSQLAALPQGAQARALDWLHRFDFTEDDLPYLRLDANGGVYFADTDLPERAPSASEGAALEPISAADAFTLHSRPGAPNVVYLDFTGHVLQNTAWNASFGESSWTAVAYDLDGSPGTFNATELSNIAEVWHRLAEDMAPFDVDVTTEEPASFGPKTGRVLITAGIDANGVVMPYGTSAGGVAYVGVWGRSDYTYYSPALVYYDNLGNGWPPYVTEASTHELGHNLSLSHDGAPGTGYYTGHGSGYVSWGPIMGVGYYTQVTQWSKGEYDGATQTQDDIAIITGHLGLRSDDHESASLAAATPLVLDAAGSVLVTNPETDPHNLYPENKGVVGTRTDFDLFYFDTSGGLVTLTVTPAWDAWYRDTRRGANLDIQASLYNSAGALVISNDPLDETDAMLSVSLAAGRYYLEITGVGNVVSPYSDYGSLGQYYISGTIPVGTPPEAPAAPSALVAADDGAGTVTLDWVENADNEDGYRVYRDGTQIAGLLANATSHDDSTVSAGSHDYYVQAYNAGGVADSNVVNVDVVLPAIAYASGESSIFGTIVAGSYLNTVAIGDFETLQEEHTGGRPSGRVSRLEHVWQIDNVGGGATVTLTINAFAPSNSEGDSFIFSYSLNGTDYVTAFVLAGGGDQEMGFALPPGTAGTVLVRLVDSDRTVGNGNRDSVSIRRLLIESSADGGGTGNTAPVATITAPGAAATYTSGDSVAFTGTATDAEEGSLSASLIWTSDRDGAIGFGASFATAGLSVGTHLVTASVTDGGGLSGNDSVSLTIDAPPSLGVAFDGMGEGSCSAGSVLSMARGSTVNATLCGAGFVAGATISFENGSGPAPAAGSTTLAGLGTSLTVAVTASSGGPKRERVWSVRITNPDGTSALCDACLTITP